MLAAVKAWAGKYLLALKVAAVVAAVVAAWFLGSAHTQKAFDAYRTGIEVQVQRQKDRIAELDARPPEIVREVVTQYVDRVKVVEKRAEVIREQVPVYLPVGTPALPAGLGLLHDAAAGGRALPDAALGADVAAATPEAAAPADPREFAETLTDNYAACLKNAEQLLALQRWVRKQYLLNPPPGDPPAWAANAE